jgi:hypothetical protein
VPSNNRSLTPHSRNHPPQVVAGNGVLGGLVTGEERPHLGDRAAESNQDGQASYYMYS